MDLAPAEAARRAAVLAFDPGALLRLVDALERLGGTGGGDDLGAALGRAWLGLMRGEAAAVESGAALLFSRASAAREPSRVIEATVLRTMIALSAGKLAEAVAGARRASLMARSEALPDDELLANLALARVRRRGGKPYLAARILEALARVSPGPAAGWLGWERLLAEGTRADGVAPAGPTPAEHAIHAGRALLLAARDGEREAFAREAERLARATAGFRDMQDEAAALAALLDPERPAPAGLLAFRRGDSDELACGLFGAVVLSADEEPGITIFALARPGQRGARMLRDGLGLIGPCRLLSGQEGTRRAHGRTDAALAVLALAGPAPMPEEEFFARVYGFAYAPATHRGVLDVLLHRARKRIGAAGAVERAHGRLGLELREPIAVADPRCSPPAAARILSALARQPLATADDIAGRLGITVRAAQIALAQLVSDGACAVRRAGRHMEYVLQDTTFSEPTSTDVLRGGAIAKRP